MQKPPIQDDGFLPATRLRFLVACELIRRDFETLKSEHYPSKIPRGERSTSRDFINSENYGSCLVSASNRKFFI